MATKLFPPFIETKLPAFADVINIEFDMNRAVGLSDVSAMALIIKTAQTGKTIGTLKNGVEPTYEPSTGKYVTSFGDLSGLNLLAGQYYKVQLAYINTDNEVGYYSAAGIIKKTTNPTLSIPSLGDSLSNVHDYTGLYSQKKVGNVKKDATEKLYSYRFDIYNKDDLLIDTSGECLHNSNQDERDDESICTWKSNIDLLKEVNYKVVFTVTTINGLVCSTSETIYAEESVDIDIDIEIFSELNYEDGTIKLFIQPSNFKDISVTGDFILVRSSSLSNFQQWDRVYNFSYLNIILSANAPVLLWEDYSVQQGEEYIYALQAYNSSGLYSNRRLVKNGNIKADFEHCYLSDATHQLKIAFNPKVSSIKNTVLESKMDTLGSKYPFIFRNGYVNYKEFPISGLLSLLTDESEKFMSFNRDALREQRIATPGGGSGKRLSTDLTSENIYNERTFKMEVLDWLNNGEPKIFRSPTEGNYIVRLMNSSLTPNDTLGRMLHTFNSTAYEVAEWNFNNLKAYNLIDVPTDKKAVLKIGQIRPTELLDAEADGTLPVDYPGFSVSESRATIYFPQAYAVNITEAQPGSKFKLHIANRDPVVIEIGGTGTYQLQIGYIPGAKNDTYFKGIGNMGSTKHWEGMKITYEYYDDTPHDTFSQIAKIDSLNEIRRYVGYDYNVNIIKPTSTAASSNVLADIRREIGMFNFIRVEKRYIQQLWKTDDGRYARNAIKTDIVEDDEWNDVVIYKVNGQYYSGKVTDENRMNGEPDCRFCLNNSTVDFSDFRGRPVGGPDPENPDSPFTESFGKIDSIRNVEVETLRIGNGLILDIGYRVRLKTYSVELDQQNRTLINRKNLWLRRKKELKELLAGVTYTKTTSVTASTYNKDKHYYYSTSKQSYVNGASTYYEDRVYYTRKTNVIPTASAVETANQAVHTAYRNYVSELNSLLTV